MAHQSQYIENIVPRCDLDAMFDTAQFRRRTNPNDTPSFYSTNAIAPSPLSSPNDASLSWSTESLLHMPYPHQISGSYQVPQLDLSLWSYSQCPPPHFRFAPGRASGSSKPLYGLTPEPSHLNSRNHSPSHSAHFCPPSIGSSHTALSPDGPHQSSPTFTTITQGEHLLLKKYFCDIRQEKERNLLIQVLTSEWLTANKEEPRYMGKSILVGFLHRETTHSSLKCSFDGCEQTFDRHDRAIAHIRRRHLDYKPYACGGACGNLRCHQKFANLAYLRGHITKMKVACSLCGKELTRKNLTRHSTACSKEIVARKRI